MRDSLAQGIMDDRLIAATIVGLVRDDTAHATGWIHHITLVARDQVKVQVLNRLACCDALVDADVEAVGVMLIDDALSDDVEQVEERRAFFGCCLVEGSDVAAWDDERVPRAHGDRIPHGDGVVITFDDGQRGGITEGAVLLGHRCRFVRGVPANVGQVGQ